MKKKPLVVLTGPTAVGKTKASIGLAKAIGGEIISADSMQVYEYMDIGSAKIRPEEMQGVPPYLQSLSAEQDSISRHCCTILISPVPPRMTLTGQSWKIL